MTTSHAHVNYQLCLEYTVLECYYCSKDIEEYFTTCKHYRTLQLNLHVRGTRRFIQLSIGCRDSSCLLSFI